ncbi:DUF2591 family protein [Rahnella sp. BCC 1045]|uniref:phage protein NinX family protein n=1 Tax=Rahnella sp. BCC 1045 TaxID=2816251 RepID=UPI001C26366F|nr:phage protein NinX family protein [Rahnella sp. BCC 1045]MBU9823165.1 DUF2591 family protein [Rahnella sp. BCC 1045]
MKDYSAMSDYDINLLVNRSLGLKHYPNEEKKVIEVFGDIVIFDPCNNPADAWPIILNSGINIFTDMIPHGLLGQARVSVINGKRIGAECLIAKNKNPLRAAMEVYLKMKEAEKGHG